MGWGNWSGRAAGVAAVVLVAAGGVTVLGPPASAVACNADRFPEDDLDGDVDMDAVVGVPDADGGSGAVDVRYSGLPSTVLRPADVGDSGDRPSGLGSALAYADLDKDGCTDLVVGARGAGRVHILFGSRTGLDLGSAITVQPPGGAGSGDFGESLAVVYRSALELGQDGDAFAYDLFVGAPASTVAGARDAGTVWRFTLTPGGAGRVSVGTGSQVTQDSPGVPGTAETGDRFGQDIVPDWNGGVVASAPMEDVGPAVNAGAIWHLRGRVPAGEWTAGEVITQDSSGVPGAAETGDHFGASLSSRGGMLVVGVPDENAGRRKDSGVVQVFARPLQDSDWDAGRMIHQDTRGVPGAVEAGDRFGAAVAAGFGLACERFEEIAIGAPGEDVGALGDAGAVTFAPARAKEAVDCPAGVLRQGSGLNGVPETGDEVGGVLAVSLAEAWDGQDISIRLLVGVPREDATGCEPVTDGCRDSGAVLSARPSTRDDGTIRVDGRRVPALTYSTGPVGGTRYGQVLPSSTFD